MAGPAATYSILHTHDASVQEEGDDRLVATPLRGHCGDGRLRAEEGGKGRKKRRRRGRGGWGEEGTGCRGGKGGEFKRTRAPGPLLRTSRTCEHTLEFETKLFKVVDENSADATINFVAVLSASAAPEALSFAKNAVLMI